MCRYAGHYLNNIHGHCQNAWQLQIRLVPRFQHHFHITNNWNTFMEFMATLATPVLGIGNLAMTLRYGTISIKFKVNNKFVTHKLKHTLYIPEAPNCLLSASRFDETGGKVIIQKGKCSLEDKNGNTVRHRILQR